MRCTGCCQIVVALPPCISPTALCIFPTALCVLSSADQTGLLHHGCCFMAAVQATHVSIMLLMLRVCCLVSCMAYLHLRQSSLSGKQPHFFLRLLVAASRNEASCR